MAETVTKRRRIEVDHNRVLLQLVFVGGDTVVLNGVKYIVDKAEYINPNAAKVVLRRA